MTLFERSVRFALFLILAGACSFLYPKEKRDLPKPAISLVRTDEGISIEMLLCGDDAYGRGWFSFFHLDGTTLCTHGTFLYPLSTTHIVIPRTHAPVMLPAPWRLIDGADRLLLYDESASFTEGSNETGLLLSVGHQGCYTDERGNLHAPRFIHQKGKWEAVVPLRELFQVEIFPDQRFSITVISGSPIVLSENLEYFLGIKAKHTTLREQKPHLLIAEGEGLISAMVPRLRFTPEGDTFGRYLIEIRRQNENPTSTKEHRYRGRTITARLETSTWGTFRFEATVLAAFITSSEEVDFLSFMEKYLPKRYEVKW